MHHGTLNCTVLRGRAAHRNGLGVVPDGGLRGKIFKAVSKKPNSKKNGGKYDVLNELLGTLNIEMEAKRQNKNSNNNDNRES